VAAALQGTHRPPRWPKAGQDQGLGIVGPQVLRVRQDNRARCPVLVPKIGWVWFKRCPALAQWKSYRIACDRSSRWHIAFVLTPGPIPAPGSGGVAGRVRGLTVAMALSTGQMACPNGLRPKQAEPMGRLQRRFARASRGSRRRKKVRTWIAGRKARDAGRRKDWVQKTSTDLARRFEVIRVENLHIKAMTRSASGTTAKPGRTLARTPASAGASSSPSGDCSLPSSSRRRPAESKRSTPPTRRRPATPANRSHATVAKDKDFVCVSGKHRANAEVNAGRNTAAGHGMTARADRRFLARFVKRKTQHALPRSHGSCNPGH
jgi:hypothetical protein